MRSGLLLIIVLFFSVQPVYSQIEITGVVLNSENGESLPSATILLEGTYRGTITNLEGQFSLSVEELPVTLTFRYIGFNSASAEVSEQTSFPLRITLSPSIEELDEIVVTERDPGLSIMERVIARKQIWRTGLENYRVEAYTRQSLSSDTAIVSISESSSIAYWHNNHGHREVQLSARQTSNLSEDQNFAGVRYLPNFYDDDIEIAGYRVVGITNPNALRYYHFRLLETTMMDGKPVYKIEVKPQRQRQPLFEGVAYVLGRDYALLEVDLKPNDVVNFPPPVQDFDLAYKQQFSNYGGDYWLPVDMRIDGRIKIGMVGLRFPAMNFRQVSRLSGYEINGSIPDSIFAEQRWFTRADTLGQKPEFTEIEQIPLTMEESRAYETIDSTKTIEEAFRPEGFLARMIDSDDDRDGGGGLLGLNSVIPKGVAPRARFNRMDGLHVGLNYNQRFSDAGFQLNGFGGYSFHSEYWDYGTSFTQRLIRVGNSSLHLTGGYENNTDTMYPSKLYSIGLSSLVMVLGGQDYFNYFRNEKMYGGLQFRRILPRTDFSFSLNRELHRSFGDLEIRDYSLFGWHDKRRDNPLMEEGTLQSLNFELGYNLSSNSLGFAGRRQVKISAEFSDDVFGSDFNFAKYDFTVDWNFDTFYQRRLFANTLDIHFSAGTSSGKLPLQRFGSIDGAKNIFSPFGTLRSRKGLPYIGNQYWLITAEHNFRTIPFELIGLTPLVERGWGIIIFGGAGQTKAEGSNYPSDLFITDGVHSEAGISLNNVFGILRIDFTKRMDQPGFFVGLSVPRYF
jgi:hypothetical protein